MSRKQITVLIATGTMNAGGAETLIMETLRHRSERVKYIMLIHYAGSIPAGVYDDEIRALGIPMVYLPSVGSVGVRRYIKLFQEKIRYIGPVDILHSHLNAAGGIIAKAAKKAGIKTRIIHCHADITYQGNVLRRTLDEVKLWLMKRYVNCFGTAFWACSEEAGKRLFSRDKRIQVIPNVIDVQNYLSNEEDRTSCKNRFGLQGKYVLGSVGRIASIKNYEFAISVLQMARATGIECEYVIFGRAADMVYYQKLQALIHRLQLDAYVHFLGNSTNVSADIACIDLLLMPSFSEGFGIAAIEAQAAGIPVLASEGIPAAVDMGLGLLRFLPLKTELWVRCIEEMEHQPRLESEHILRTMRGNGYDSVETVNAIEERYLALAGRDG